MEEGIRTSVKLIVDDNLLVFFKLFCLVTGFVRLNTRCHLLAFAAKVEKQLQATVSNQ